MNTSPGSNALISFPLSKFSWASDPPNVNKSFSWKHALQNLVVVFDTVCRNEIQPSNQMSQMKVVQGTETLV